MSGILFFLFVAVFGFVFVSILFGAIRTMSLSGKVFQLVERQLDEQMSRVPQGSPDKVDTLRCGHCGSQVAFAEKCANCGAGLS